MDSWPSDSRGSIKHKGKGEGKERETSRLNYPHLAHGQLGAATLIERDGQLEWTCIVDKPSAHGTRNLVGQNSVIVFPPTRPPPVSIPHATIQQRAERGANFIRTYFPDSDIPAELIREALAEDDKTTRKTDTYDPYLGNLLDLVVRTDQKGKRSMCLAFPMGELKNSLNFSPFITSKIDETFFEPAYLPVRQLDTPIRQIVSSRSTTNQKKQSAYISVRTFGSTFFYEIKPGVTGRDVPHLHDIGVLTSSDIGSRSAVDVKVLTAPFEALVVNDHGAVYTCNNSRGNFPVSPAYPSPSDFLGDHFWRLALGQERGSYFLASNKTFQRLDFRTKADFIHMFSVAETNRSEMLTCIEDQIDDHLVRLCSTSQILWLDPRVPGKPLLGYKHEREYERSLQIQTINIMDSPRTFLSSRNNGLLTVYDVSRQQDNLLHVNTPPHAISTSIVVDGRVSGRILFHYPLDTKFGETRLFSLTERGSIHALDLAMVGADVPSQTLRWSTGVQELKIATATLKADVGALSARERNGVDMFPIYDKIFRIDSEEASAAEEQKAEAVYELLDQIPLYWQSTDAPVDHILTSYDVVLRSGEEPDETSRSDFLTGSILNSKRGFRALSQGRLSVPSIGKNASWHRSLESTLRIFSSDITNDANQSVDNLKKYDLSSNPERTGPSMRREAEAREQLALDLALSTDVFSSHTFNSKTRMEDDRLETMTEALSINAEPPPINFQYLRPTLRAAVDHYDRNAQEDKYICPMGVRLLLKDWEVGSDLEDFVFRDPYGNDDQVETFSLSTLSPRITSDTQPLRTHTREFLANQSQPPLVVPQVLNTHRPPTIGQSQPAHFYDTQTTLVDMGQSQEIMASTQILPGPFGGRLAPSRKKPQKKRLGGF